MAVIMKSQLVHSQTPTQHSESGITEIIMPQSEPPLDVALPMLAYLSHHSNNRWITWITQTPITKSLLLDRGFKLSNLRLVYADDDQDVKWIYWEALNNGRSDTVIAAVDTLSQDEMKNFEQAASAGRSRGLLLRLRH